jgi:tetratricopeptide (TPR) repeat protein
MPDSKLINEPKSLAGGEPVPPELSENTAEHERALEAARDSFGASSIEAAAILLKLGRAHCRAGSFGEAHRAYVRALEIAEDKLGPDHVRLASIYYGLAELELARGRFATGEPYARRSLEICQQSAAGTDEIAEHKRILEALLEEQGRSAECESNFGRDKS